jgi:hypothetical protein
MTEDLAACKILTLTSYMGMTESSAVYQIPQEQCFKTMVFTYGNEAHVSLSRFTAYVNGLDVYQAI